MISDDDLQHFARNIKGRPDRVVVDRNGHAVLPRVALRDYGRGRIDVIYIRSDGWSVGAAEDLRAVAEGLWREHWVGIMRPPWGRAEPYAWRQEANNGQGQG